MGNLTLRSVKGSALTHTEVDNNFGYFTGSHAITGSLTASDGFAGNVVGTASYATLAVTASYAISASYEINHEISSSYAETASIATSASYATTASYASFSGYTQNIPTAESIPTAPATEGTIVGSWVSSTYRLHIYLGGGWRSITLS